MKVLYLLIFYVIIFITGCSSDSPFQGKSLDNEKDTISYCLGINVANKLKAEGITEINSDAFKLAVEQVFKNDSDIVIDEEKSSEILQKYFTELKKKKNKQNLIDAESFLEKNKTSEDVEITESGLQFIILNKGNGPKPLLNDFITINYIGYTFSGEEFDNTYKSSPVSFPVKSAKKGLQEALINMRVGEKWKIFVHPDLAYGSEGAGEKIEPNMLLIYEIELLSIEMSTK